MKYLLALTLLLGSAGLRAWAQGTLYFYNHVPSIGLDAPVYNTDGKSGVTGTYFLAQLYAGPSASSLSPVGPTANFGGPKPGYWFSYGPSLNRVVSDVPPGAVAYAQVRVWSTLLGSTYDQVVARGGKHGMSTVFTAVTGGDTLGGTQPPSFPAYLGDLKSFTLTGIEPDVPEPATAALVALAVVGGMLRYWNRRYR